MPNPRRDLSREQLLALVEELECQLASNPVPEAHLLRLQDGDILALVYPGYITCETAERIKRYFDEHLSQWLASHGIDAKIAVLGGRVEPRIITEEAVERLEQYLETNYTGNKPRHALR